LASEKQKKWSSGEGILQLTKLKWKMKTYFLTIFIVESNEIRTKK